MVDMYIQHGWGWDAAGWTGWNQRMAFINRWRIADRGYFGTPITADLTKTDMLVVHSLGLHLVPVDFFLAAKWIVIFSSFLHFHPVEAIAARRSRRLVQRMLRRLEDDPLALLDEFYLSAYRPQACCRRVPAQPVQALLLEDLVLLNEHVFDPTILHGAAQVLIVHGGQDHIVPLTQGYALHHQVPGSVFHVIEEGGHALPFTHANVCRALVEKMVQDSNNDM